MAAPHSGAAPTLRQRRPHPAHQAWSLCMARRSAAPLAVATATAGALAMATGAAAALKRYRDGQRAVDEVCGRRACDGEGGEGPRPTPTWRGAAGGEDEDGDAAAALARPPFPAPPFQWADTMTMPVARMRDVRSAFLREVRGVGWGGGGDGRAAGGSRQPRIGRHLALLPIPDAGRPRGQAVHPDDAAVHGGRAAERVGRGGGREAAPRARIR